MQSKDSELKTKQQQVVTLWTTGKAKKPKDSGFICTFYLQLVLAFLTSEGKHICVHLEYIIYKLSDF